MNLYDLYSKPEELFHYNNKILLDFNEYWAKYEGNTKRLDDARHLFKNDAENAYNYAKYYLDAPFPEGEAAIAKDAEYAFDYAISILNARFKAGEPKIMES